MSDTYSYQAVNDIFQKLWPKPIDLASPKRYLVREGDLIMFHANKRKKVSRHFYLFNDRLLITKSKNAKAKYSYFLKIDISLRSKDIELERIPNSTSGHEFRIHSSKTTYIFYASSVKEKDRWCTDIYKSIKGDHEPELQEKRRREEATKKKKVKIVISSGHDSSGESPEVELNVLDSNRITGVPRAQTEGLRAMPRRKKLKQGSQPSLKESGRRVVAKKPTTVPSSPNLSPPHSEVKQHNTERRRKAKRASKPAKSEAKRTYAASCPTGAIDISPSPPLNLNPFTPVFEVNQDPFGVQISAFPVNPFSRLSAPNIPSSSIQQPSSFFQKPGDIFGQSVQNPNANPFQAQPLTGNVADPINPFNQGYSQTVYPNYG
jgi:hypothetical protein